MLVTLQEAKQYLRLDSSDEDLFLPSLMDTAETLVYDVARKPREEPLTEEEKTVIKTASLFATAYLYEHREEADHKELTGTLKYLLFSIRKEGF